MSGDPLVAFAADKLLHVRPALDRLTADFLAWAKGRAATALALVVAGAVVEGISVLMLVPVIGIALGDGPQAEGNEWLSGILSSLGQDSLGGILVAFCGLIALRFAILWARDIRLARLEQSFIAEIRLRLFRSVAMAPWSVASRLGHGQIGHALGRDLDRAASGVSALLRGATAALMLVVQLGLALWLAPFVTLIVVTLGGVVYGALGPLRHRATQLGQQMTIEDYKLFSTLNGFLRGLKPAKAHGLERRYLESFARASHGFADQVVAFQRDSSLAMLTLQSTVAVLALGAVFVGYRWLEATPEVLIVVLILMVRIAAPLQSLQFATQAMRHGRTSYLSALKHISENLSEAPVIEDTRLEEAPEFTLRGVSWAPSPAHQMILKDLTVEVPAGRVTAVAGPSGVGKTTLCDILIGLQTPNAGEVLLDGAPMSAEARARLQPSLAYVAQQSLLLAESVRANLAQKKDISDARIWQALETVGADGMIRALEGGLDAPVQPDAPHFSGGERQRIHLAAALLRQPKVLILDEATNALDVESEKQILLALFAAAQGATIVMISHREATLELADHVIRLGAPLIQGHDDLEGHSN